MLDSNEISKKPDSYYYKLFRITKKDGKVSTVSLDPVLATKAAHVMGGLKPVGKFVRAVASEYEDSMHKSCSGYVSSKLKEAIAPAEASS